MANTFVRISGFGVRYVPRTPFRIVAAEPLGAAVGDSLAIAIESADDVDEALLTAAPPFGTPELLEKCGQLSPGPSWERWRLEIGGVYVIDWADGFEVVSSPIPEQPPFFMFAGGEGMFIYPQGPLDVASTPRLSQMKAEGQREVERNDAGPFPYVEFAYRHDGEPWRQRHIVVALAPSVRMIVTSQAHEDVSARARDAAMKVAASIRPFALTRN